MCVLEYYIDLVHDDVLEPSRDSSCRSSNIYVGEEKRKKKKQLDNLQLLLKLHCPTYAFGAEIDVFFFFFLSSMPRSHVDKLINNHINKDLLSKKQP